MAAHASRLDSWRGSLRAIGDVKNHPYLIILVVALSLRLIFLALMLGHHDSADSIVQIAPDSTFYWAAANDIAGSCDWNSRGVQIFGPGYPGILALGILLTGGLPVLILLIQVLLSTLAAVLMAELAYQLTHDRTMAIVAGLLAATSITSISLASILLSDSVFTLMLIIAFLLLVTGVRRDRLLPALISGVILGCAALTRSAGVYLFLLIPAIVFAATDDDTVARRVILRRRLRVIAMATSMMLLVLGLWVLHNYRQYDVVMVAHAPAVAKMRISALFMGSIHGTSFDDAMAELGESAQARTEFTSNDLEAVSHVADSTFGRLLRDHPGPCIVTYLDNLDKSVHTDWGTLQGQFPRWWRGINEFSHSMEEWPFRYRVTLLSLIGLLILVYRRRFALGAALLAVYVYFALLAGMTLWQGTRIFHPAQISWSILVAVELVESSRWIIKKVRSHLRERE